MIMDKFKNIAVVLFKSGHKETIYCEGVSVGTSVSLFSSQEEIISVKFKNPEYDSIQITGTDVSAVFVKSNPNYKED